MNMTMGESFKAEPTTNEDSWIGIDESGKGDYFGPLVVAAAYVDRSALEFLSQLGVRDSKAISDRRVLDMSQKIRSNCLHSIVSIGPPRYNELLAQMGNLNKLLAWGHARALENILLETDCKRAIADQFGDERFILDALLKKGKQINLMQKPRAESDIAVAAASILARAEFLKKLEELSQAVGMALPKGASRQVEATARKLVEKNGPNILRGIAKVHFKTTQRVIGSLGN
jgi:ribonuclease HIII